MIKHVHLSADVRCSGNVEQKPSYRLYVNDELFTERTWRWDVNTYINESIVIVGEPGTYELRVDCTHANNEFKLRNLRVEDGCARVIDSRRVEITHENP